MMATSTTPLSKGGHGAQHHVPLLAAGPRACMYDDHTARVGWHGASERRESSPKDDVEVAYGPDEASATWMHGLATASDRKHQSYAMSMAPTDWWAVV